MDRLLAVSPAQIPKRQTYQFTVNFLKGLLPISLSRLDSFSLSLLVPRPPPHAILASEKISQVWVWVRLLQPLRAVEGMMDPLPPASRSC